jgi:hypothetical protein
MITDFFQTDMRRVSSYITRSAVVRASNNCPFVLYAIASGSVREFRLQLFVTSDRGLGSARLMFMSSDRTGPLRRSDPLTWASILPLVAAKDPA